MLLNKKSDNFKWTPSPTYIIRKKLILNFLKKNKFNIKNFLEIGVGSGDLSKQLIKLYPNGTGIDLNQDSINKSIENINCARINVFKKDFFDLTETNKYDLIIALEVIEHIKDDISGIKKINSLLKNDGLFIMSVPAHQKKWSILDEWGGHFRRYEKKILIKILENENFEIVKFYNYGYPLSNILRNIHIKLWKNRKIETSIEENTKKSGLDRNFENKFKLLFNDFFIYPFFIIQKIFLNQDLSPAYLVIAKKKKNN